MKKLNKVWLVMLAFVVLMIMSGCVTQAQVARRNVSQEADNFNVTRRLAVLNMRSDMPVFELIGNFSLQESGDRLVIVVEVEPGRFKNHFVNVNENTMWVVEDVSGADVSSFHYEVNFLPQMLQPFEVVSRE